MLRRVKTYRPYPNVILGFWHVYTATYRSLYTPDVINSILTGPGERHGQASIHSAHLAPAYSPMLLAGGPIHRSDGDVNARVGLVLGLLNVRSLDDKSSYTADVI